MFRAETDSHRERLPLPNKVGARRSSRRAERPLTATGAVRNAQSPEARQAAALDFQKSFPPGGCGAKRTDTPDPKAWAMPNVVDFYPVARPGVEAPLGWTLSKYSQSPLNNSSATPTTCAPRRSLPPGSPVTPQSPEPATDLKITQAVAVSHETAPTAGAPVSMRPKSRATSYMPGRRRQRHP